MQQIGKLFRDGKVKDGDYSCTQMHGIPTVLQLKYMAELLKVKIKIGGMWHVCLIGSQDFLGRLIGNKSWVRNTEQAMFDVFDNNFYATDSQHRFNGKKSEIEQYTGLNPTKVPKCAE